MAGTGTLAISRGAPAAPAESAYARHRPEETVLYKLLAEHWRPFLAETQAGDESGCGLPRFVVDEVEAFLRCGILAHGFIRVACDACRESRVVAFSCKRRGFCPSCLGRRMCDFAAYLRDHVMPHVPVRQWVLTVPFGLRFGMAFDPALTGIVLRGFVGVVSRWLRRRARAYGIRGALKTGGVTVIQRFGSALNLNVHFHTLMIDGVYEIRPSGTALFHPISAPTDEEVAAVAEQVYRKVARMLNARGDDGSDALARGEPALTTLASASVAGVTATGPRRGARTLRLGSGNAPEAAIAGRRCAAVEGFSLHANVRVAANDRDGLEHLARYLARPPVATERLPLLPDGRVALRFKRPFADGTEAVVFTPFELIERLLPLIPRPRKHTIRFHGILAPAAGYRSKVVPASETTTTTIPPPSERPTPHRLPWAELLRRVFLVDAIECPRCHGRMRIIAAVTEPGAIDRVLRHLGESLAPPPIASARAPPRGDEEQSLRQLDLPDLDFAPGASS